MGAAGAMRRQPRLRCCFGTPLVGSHAPHRHRIACSATARTAASCSLEPARRVRLAQARSGAAGSAIPLVGAKSAACPSCLPRCSIPRDDTGDKGVRFLGADLDLLTAAERHELATHCCGQLGAPSLRSRGASSFVCASRSGPPFTYFFIYGDTTAPPGVALHVWRRMPRP